MKVDLSLRRSPAYRVASIVRIGPWKEENLRAEFQELVRWARRQGVRTGRWIFFERGSDHWEACLEIRGSARPEGRVRLKTLPATWTATITFDPDRLSSRIVYHALNDWVRRRRRAGGIRSARGVREVYPGDPWNDRSAWSLCRVEFLVRR